MAITSLNNPTDIPWTRLATSEDMLDVQPCDASYPARWRPSLTLYRYVPEEEHQTYEDRRIVYLKLSCTLAGYQPAGSELTARVLDTLGRLRLDKRRRREEPDPTAATFAVDRLLYSEVEEALNAYYPAHSAIIEVSVLRGAGGTAAEAESGPYVMDCQPVSRRMYELVTETGERASRSLGTVNVRKAAGTTASNEVLDIDLGFSRSSAADSATNVGVGASQDASLGVGVSQGSSGSYAHNQQLGTRNLGQEEQSRVETSDRARERRELLSHTTQINNVYHLFDAFHIGTNRAVFLIQPRPYTQEVTPIFVRGPRPIDGVQDIFLVVNQPASMRIDDLCVSVRLDTGHLYESTTAQHDIRDEVVRIPTTGSIRAAVQSTTQTGATKTSRTQTLDVHYQGMVIGTGQYQEYELVVDREIPWSPAEIGMDDYLIDSWRFYEPPGAGVQVDVTRDAAANELRVHFVATARAYFFTKFLTSTFKLSSGSGNLRTTYTAGGLNDLYRKGELRLDLSERKKGEQTADAWVKLKVRLKSAEATIEGPPTREVLITTRGLCHCPALDPNARKKRSKEGVLASGRRVDPAYQRQVEKGETPPAGGSTKAADDGMTPRAANLLGEAVMGALRNNYTARHGANAVDALASEFVQAKLRRRLGGGVGGSTPEGGIALVDRLAKAFRMEAPEAAAYALEDDLHALAAAADMTAEEALRDRLLLLGFPRAAADEVLRGSDAAEYRGTPRKAE